MEIGEFVDQHVTEQRLGAKKVKVELVTLTVDGEQYILHLDSERPQDFQEQVSRKQASKQTNKQINK